MIYPIVAYGDPVLKKKAAEVPRDYPDLAQLIADMYETMYNAHGVGLAAPQIGLSLRLFVTDGAPFEEEAAGSFAQRLQQSVQGRLTQRAISRRELIARREQ